ncbi:hypothetical protein DYB32_006377 [Aphanomyces invadans]|uniref:Sugar transporter SWEET1 n=1 Tax=Aphanomyces invadans TaxID=157072 RepID=A0A3R6ZN78_9STRA|nr:hypothetical protein DYB32_006377 [Aphanomyces invadans]
MTIAEGLATVVQVVATASSFYVASSPYASIKEIHVNKSTGKLSAIPLLCMLLKVLKTRSVAHLPRKLIFATWISSGAWCLTGIILDNAFIKYPNAINFILGSLQLALFLIFPSASVAVAQSSGKGVDLDRVGLLTADPDEISSGVDKSSQVDTYIHATHDIK